MLAGRVLKPHGIQGEVVVAALSDRPERFEPGALLYADYRTFVVVSARPHQGRLLVRFSGVSDRTAAEGLRGARLEAEPLPQDEDRDAYLVSELVGMLVVTEDGRELGEVEAVVELPPSAEYDLLEVAPAEGPKWLLPATEEYVAIEEDDTGFERLVVVSPPEGLVPDEITKNATRGRTPLPAESTGARPPWSLMRIDVITIFPEFFTGPFNTSLLARAVGAGILDLRVHDLRMWATNRHRSVDDAPYGGGAGMVMRADVWFAAAEAVWADEGPETSYRVGGPRPRTILLSPRGVPLTQQLVAEFTAESRLVVCCGRYEGVDERVHQAVATDEVSIGDYVLAGGEAAAVVIVEAVSRLLPGVMGNVSSSEEESFNSGLLEYPHYTRPHELRGMTVPDVLRSGDHGAVSGWRRAQALRLTRERRPDLYAAWLGEGGEPSVDDEEAGGVRTD